MISRVVYTVIFSLTGLASLIGNAVVCKAICALPSRTPLAYHLVSNLAVAEIIGTLCLPFMFAYQYLGHWPFGNLACKLIIPLHMLSLFVVTNTLATIAAYRFVFVAVQAPMPIASHRSRVLLLALLWLCALAVALPAVFFHKNEPAADPEKSHLMYCNSVNLTEYEIARFVLNFGVPYLVMVVSYGAVAVRLKRRLNNKKKAAAAASFECGSCTIETQVGGGDAAIPQQDTARRQRSSCVSNDLENDLLKMIYALIIIFVVCYLPYQVHLLFNLVKGYDKYPEARKYAEIVSRYLFLLTTFPSALHPLCYGTMSKFLARSFARLVLCKGDPEMR